MKKKIYLIAGFVLSISLSTVSHADKLTKEEKEFLSYGQKEGFIFDINYYNNRENRYYNDDKDYTSYYENGRYYYVKDYTYMDEKDRKHYVIVKYYYDSNNDRIYEIQDYYYNSYGDKIYEKNEKDLRNYNSSADIYSQDSYNIKIIDNKRHYIYEDVYRYDDIKHYVNIDYYYKNDKKIYKIQDYYYDKNGNKKYIVDVWEKELDYRSIKYYLEYYLKSREYKDRQYERNYKNYGYYYDKDGRKIYYNEREKIYYDDFKYTDIDDYIRKINQSTNVRPRYHNNQKYFGDEGIYEYDYAGSYEKDGIRYNSIASLLPNKMPPNENTWPKKSNLTSKKQDMIEELANQIEFERKIMGKIYFNQDVINHLTEKYFPKEYKNASNSRDRLEIFLYYFGFADAFFDKYSDERNIRGFLYNYAEPMYSIYKNFESGYYTSQDINDMKYSGKSPNKEINGKAVKKNLKEKQEENYFEEKNKKIREER